MLADAISTRQRRKLCTATDGSNPANTGAAPGSSSTATIRIDTKPPTTTVAPTPGPPPPGATLASFSASATVKNTTGATLGTISPIQCWNSRGVAIMLGAADNPGGSGVQQLTYSASGAQPIPNTSVAGRTASVSLSTVGLTALSYSATDSAGNQEATKSFTIFVGSFDAAIAFACAAPTPAFALPAHGTLILQGTTTTNGTTSSFSKTFRF